MAATLEFELVSPEKLLVSEAVEMVVVPGAEGDFGVMAHHVPFISIIRPGVVELHKKSGVEKIFITAGYAETHETECTILAESAEPVSSLSREKVESELLTLRKDLEYAKDEMEKARAEKALEVAEAKLRAVA